MNQNTAPSTAKKEILAVTRHQLALEIKEGGTLYQELSACYARLRVTDSPKESRAELLTLTDWLFEEIENHIDRLVKEDDQIDPSDICPFCGGELIQPDLTDCPDHAVATAPDLICDSCGEAVHEESKN